MNGILHELEKYKVNYDHKNFTLELFKQSIKEFMENKEKYNESLRDKEKYFTPQKEDIRIGYYLEYPNIHNDSIWIPYRVRECDFNEKLFEDLSRARVPYITKEDIIDRGWRCIHNREYLYEKDEKSIIHFTNGQLEDEYDDTVYLSTFRFHNRHGDNIIFQGEIKDVNTFDYIVKLLKIL